MNLTLETYLFNGRSEFLSTCTNYRIRPYKGLSDGEKTALDLGVNYVFARQLYEALPQEDRGNSSYENFMKRCEQDYSKALQELSKRESSKVEAITTSTETTSKTNAFIRNKLFHHARSYALQEKNKILTERNRVEQEQRGYLDPNAFPSLPVKEK